VFVTVSVAEKVVRVLCTCATSSPEQAGEPPTLYVYQCSSLLVLSTLLNFADVRSVNIVPCNIFLALLLWRRYP
jgi:hypothetical protein